MRWQQVPGSATGSPGLWAWVARRTLIGDQVCQIQPENAGKRTGAFWRQVGLIDGRKVAHAFVVRVIEGMDACLSLDRIKLKFRLNAALQSFHRGGRRHSDQDDLPSPRSN